MWTYVIKDAADLSLAKIDGLWRRRILGRLDWLAENFGKLRPTALTGEWHGYFRLRIGDFRAIYTADWRDKIIYVHTIGKRDDIYKNSP